MTDKKLFNFAGVCRYNLSVSCTEKDKCQKCGWNPDVEEERKLKTKARLYGESKRGA